MHIRAIENERKKQKDRETSGLKLSSPTLIPKSQNRMIINLTCTDRHIYLSNGFVLHFYLTRSPSCGFNTDVTLHEHRIILLLVHRLYTQGQIYSPSITWNQWHSHDAENPLTTLSFIIINSIIKADDKQMHAIKFHILLNSNMSMSSVYLCVPSTWGINAGLGVECV